MTTEPVAAPQPLHLRAFPPLRHVNPANAVTSLSVALGFSGMLLALRGAVSIAVVFGIVAIACDVIDGLIARKLKLGSPFGATLDSLADAVSFCLLPAAIAFALGLDTGALAALPVAYALAGVWRLAHYSEAGLDMSGGRPAFRGMPTPYAAAVMFLLATLAIKMPSPATLGLLAGALATCALAMLAGFRFLKGGPHYALMWLALPLAAIALFWR